VPDILVKIRKKLRFLIDFELCAAVICSFLGYFLMF